MTLPSTIPVYNVLPSTIPVYKVLVTKTLLRKSSNLSTMSVLLRILVVCLYSYLCTVDEACLVLLDDRCRSRGAASGRPPRESSPGANSAARSGGAGGADGATWRDSLPARIRSSRQIGQDVAGYWLVASAVACSLRSFSSRFRHFCCACRFL